MWSTCPYIRLPEMAAGLGKWYFGKIDEGCGTGQRPNYGCVTLSSISELAANKHGLWGLLCGSAPGGYCSFG
jgi:hypothetical protein